MNSSASPLKRVVITGAGGFVGTSLCHYLPQLGNYQLTGSARQDIELLKDTFPTFQWMQWDVTRAPETPFPQNVDTIIHLATANNILCNSNPQAALNLSVSGTENVIELAKANGVKNIIHFSTIQVYGTELSGSITEKKLPKLESRYALYHRYGEQVMEMATNNEDINGTIVRLANSVGQYLSPTVNRWSLVPACFCQEAEETGQITLRSSGKQLRNFIPVKDVAYVVHSLLQTPINQRPPIINLAAEKNHSILELAQWVQRIYKTEFSKDIKLTVESDQPNTANNFEFSRTHLPIADYSLEQALQQEIKSIITSLQTK